MRLAILTSSLNGTASEIIPTLLGEEKNNIAIVIYSKEIVKNKKKYVFKKLKKIYKIGLLGALVGYYIRRWYKIDPFLNKNNIPLDVFCKYNAIPFCSVDNWFDRNTISLIEDCHIDLGISLGNSYIPEFILNAPKYGMINVHHELLPEYQNAQSIIWQIFNGSDESGYSIHKMSKKIDNGPILFKEHIKFKIYFKLSKTVKLGYQSLIQASAVGLTSFLKNYNPSLELGEIQKNVVKYTTPSLCQFSKILYNHYKLYKRQNLL